jgi:hypothetical protein
MDKYKVHVFIPKQCRMQKQEQYKEKRQTKKKRPQQPGKTSPLPWPVEPRVAYPSMTLLPELVRRMDQLPAAGTIIDTSAALGAFWQCCVTVHTSDWTWGDGDPPAADGGGNAGLSVAAAVDDGSLLSPPLDKEREEEYSDGENEKQVTA